MCRHPISGRFELTLKNRSIELKPIIVFISSLFLVSCGGGSDMPGVPSEVTYSAMRVSSTEASLSPGAFQYWKIFGRHMAIQLRFAWSPTPITS